jgi:Flp pilus assembly protein TadG
MKSNKFEKGQAIIMVAFAIIVLIGFAALAIDGGRVLSDRRHAQNAADTAAFAAALAKIQNENYTDAGKNRAGTNGYDDNGTSNVVEVHLCSDTGITCNLQLQTGEVASDYIQVKITSHVQTIFARVLGIQQLTNRVQAVAKAKPPVVTSWFDGKAMVSTMKGCKGDNGDPNIPFVVGGNGTTVVNNSGIFVNSSCPAAFVDNGGSNLVTTDPGHGVCIVGGIGGSVNGVTPPPVGNCGTQRNIEDYTLPEPDAYCADPGSITDMGGYYEATPGYFNMSGNQTFPDVSPSGKLYLHKGVYCLYNGISLNGNWEITTDLNDNDAHDSATEGILFYVPDGDVTFNGGSTMEIHAIDSADYPVSIQ